MRRPFKISVCRLKLIAAAAGIVIPALLLSGFAASSGKREENPASPSVRKRAYVPPGTADHTKFEILKQDFPDGPSVTKACLSCHTEAAKQIMKTSHWTWICPRARKELGVVDRRVVVGKAAYVINNFCIALPSNEPRCTSCHAGYGWKDKNFDFSDQTHVDCLVCHEQTGTYRKFPTGAGHPVYKKDFPEGREWPKGSGKKWSPVDLSKVAQSVGLPTRRNCGSCHFFGGGGEGVKHGDMDKTLFNPPRTLDVHMAKDGVNFACQECHTTRKHEIAGRCFETPAYTSRKFVLRGLETNLLPCESCHGSNPHPDRPKINDHTDVVSCQACHVPRFARDRPTKMWWDWSKAGKLRDGKPYLETTEVKGDSVHGYNSKKGEFVWAKDEIPEYIWYDGSMKFVVLGEILDDSKPARETSKRAKGRFDKVDLDKPLIWINWTEAKPRHAAARIWPVKIHRGKQPYDPGLKVLVNPKLFPYGPDEDEAFWKSYDWGRSVVAGMKYVGFPYSGKFGFIQTAMIWPLSHMVAPKEDTVSCVECHTRRGRMQNVEGVYLPGRDRNRTIDRIGLALILLSLAASLIHGFLRILFGRLK